MQGSRVGRYGASERPCPMEEPHAHPAATDLARPFAAAASVALLGSALLVAPGAAAGGIAATTILTGYSRPVLVTAPVASSRKFYIVEQTGKIRVATYDSDGGWRKVGTFLDIRNRVRSSGSEQGLLGLAFHPDYATQPPASTSTTPASPTARPWSPSTQRCRSTESRLPRAACARSSASPSRTATTTAA